MTNIDRVNDGVQKKKIIFYGAYDRYNYGDNLMPIIFQFYIEKYHPLILQEYVIEYCAIGNSDLSQYSCFKTNKIANLLGSTPEDSLLIVIGGEVLCATNLTLLMHMQNTRFSHAVVKAGRYLLRRHLNVFTNKTYGTRWEFPYIPPKSVFKHKIKLAFNTVGGGISGLSVKDQTDVTNRLKSADYISVRDKRTQHNLESKIDAVLYPDSVFLISELISSDFLNKEISPSIKDVKDKPYFCFQASPHKVGSEVGEVVDALIQIAKLRNEKIVLLPIGYASGHDDVYYLRQIQKRLEGEGLLLQDLNVWEIMYTIKNASLFIGTSLHGIITAMAFNVPHFGLNPNISKVNSFLKDWSIFPFNRSMALEQIVSASSEDFSAYTQALENNSFKLGELVKENNSNIVKLCR
ncbi:polysaccharide pyruvyl transferase family protein [Paraglaciecola sp. L1A13]|uniref:polysaccharide pyruvyl transferase family protein n=1 Tax=Paraglaciecola sp. L1A13 TaxID=2686359 RepID=UPI00131B8226|nr:polysaccharide pyruvyl transferase family protein [Paraglaciecola sp. L1A13]